MCELWLIRHGETEWSRSGAHTGRTDLPLTAAGEQNARKLAPRLSGAGFSLVLASPLRRAMDTCRLAGLGAQAQVEPDLMEWDYGAYEGRTTDEVRRDAPDWSIWDGPVPDGESIAQVAARAECVIERACRADGRIALFAHGHILRVLTACWLGLAPQNGRLLALSTGTLSTLGHERETRVILKWNA